MKIAVFTYGFPEKPDGSYTPAIIEYLCNMAENNEIIVFSVGGGRPKKKSMYSFENLRVIATGDLSGATFILRMHFLLRQFRKSNTEKSFDIVHGMWHVGSLTATLFGLIAQKPILLSMMGGEIVHLKNLNYGVLALKKWRWLLRFCFRKASVITAGSKYYAARIVDFYPRITHKVKQVPLGILSSKFSDVKRTTGDEVKVLCVSSLQPVKNSLVILDSAKRFANESIEWSFAGEGPQNKALKEKIEAYGLQKKVHLLGWNSLNDFCEIYQEHDLLISASSHEAQGMALIEAAASGLPILSTRVGVAEELQSLGASIEFIESAEGIPELLQTTLKNLPKRRAQARLNSEKIRQCFDLQRCRKNFLEIHQKTIQSKGNRAVRPWHENRLPIYMYCIRPLRKLVFSAIAPLLMHIRKKNADTRVGSLKFHTQLDVFHPRFFFSGKILSRYLVKKKLDQTKLLDMGTGSGIVGVFSAKNGASVTAVDVNPAAVELARRNAQLNQLNGAMKSLESNLFGTLETQKFDWIAFNPPFFPTPITSVENAAWSAGKDYDTINRFLDQAENYLSTDGKIVLILSSDMPLGLMDNKFTQYGYDITSHKMHNHFFEQFHLIELKKAVNGD